MTARKVNLVLSTCFMVASKYEEVDDRLVFIGDIQNFYVRELKQQIISPTWEDMVEMERRLMNFFNWDINFLLPIHFLEMYLANGVLF